jgi:hypothetical protein
MKPSSTLFGRLPLLSALLAGASLALIPPASARVVAGFGRLPSIRNMARPAPVASPLVRSNIARIPAQPHRDIAQGQRFRAHHMRGGAIGFIGPFGSSVVIDGARGNPPPFEAGDAAEPGIVAFVPPGCIRPLIIQLKPLRGESAARLPRIVPCSPVIARF